MSTKITQDFRLANIPLSGIASPSSGCKYLSMTKPSNEQPCHNAVTLVRFALNVGQQDGICETAFVNSLRLYTFIY